jgi:hypothetical protein
MGVSKSIDIQLMITVNHYRSKVHFRALKIVGMHILHYNNTKMH